MADLLQSLPNSDIDEIDVMSLRLLGLLWCAGTPLEKAEVFTEVVNPPEELPDGKIVQAEFIAANDRDFKPMFELLFMLATRFTLELSQEMATENPAFAINPRNVPRPYKILYREVFASEIDMFPEVFEAFRLGEHV